MADVYEIRHANLLRLVDEYGSVAEINEAMGRKRNDAALFIVKNKAIGARGKPRQIGTSLARTIEKGLHLQEGWMDTNHSMEPEEDKDLITLNKLNVEAGCDSSGGPACTDVAVVERIQVSQEWFKQNISRYRTEGHELVTARGDSMEPTLKNGDLVVIDRFDTEITKRDGVFCVLIDNDLYLKRVQRVPGSLRFISDNRLYDPFEISLSEVESRVIVFGRMVNSLNLKRYD